MFVIEREADEAVRIGRHVLKVLAVQPGQIVVALLDPKTDCLDCACELVDGHCPSCHGGAHDFEEDAPFSGV